MDQAAFQEIRRRLDDERSHLVAQLADMGIDPATGTPDGDRFDQGFADSGQSTAEKARVLSMAEEMLGTVKEVDAAIARMQDGTYGTCENCGKPIGDERLDARPVARLCLDCKKSAS